MKTKNHKANAERGATGSLSNKESLDAEESDTLPPCPKQPSHPPRRSQKRRPAMARLGRDKESVSVEWPMTE